MTRRDTGIMLGVPIDRRMLDEIVADSLRAVDRESPPIVFACANAHSLETAHRAKDFREALNNADIVVADGVGVTVMARFANISVGPRITGEEYFSAVMNALEKRGSGKVFFFGSSNDVLSRIAGRMKKTFPSLDFVGSFSPPYRPWSQQENTEMIGKINETSPDVLWVGMTAPKQEKWVYENRALLDAPVIGSVGAVFDYFAGTIKSPPRWIRTMGIESIYRTIMNPRHIWKRMFTSNPKFVLLVIWHHIFGFSHR